MDDVTAHFLVAVGDVCESARIARLPVSVRTTGGEDVSGVPEPVPVGESAGNGLDETGYEDTLRIAGRTMRLQEVQQVTLTRP